MPLLQWRCAAHCEILHSSETPTQSWKTLLRELTKDRIISLCHNWCSYQGHQQRPKGSASPSQSHQGSSHLSANKLNESCLRHRDEHQWLNSLILRGEGLLTQPSSWTTNKRFRTTAKMCLRALQTAVPRLGELLGRQVLSPWGHPIIDVPLVPAGLASLSQPPSPVPCVLLPWQVLLRALHRTRAVWDTWVLKRQVCWRCWHTERIKKEQSQWKIPEAYYISLSKLMLKAWTSMQMS